ncbi:MAG: hypothetical protein GY820_31245 [Gammaproteobacteria bacterium]|nr:hypothetical protein [Gammaproteobacteria bacterium]
MSTQALGGTWIHNTTVSDVRWYGSGNGYITTADTSNPECVSGSVGGHRYLNENISGSDKMISLALSAMMAGKKVNVLLSGCYDNTHSIISGIVVKSQ